MADSITTPHSNALKTISDIKALSDYTWINNRITSILLYAIEIIFYLFFITTIAAAFWLPNGAYTAEQTINNSVTLQTNVKIAQIMNAMLLIKITLAVSAFLMLVPALAFRKWKLKNNRLEQINNLVTKHLKDTL